MTERDDLHTDPRADDRRLRAALRALPAARTGEGFTDDVLARLAARAPRAAASGWSRRMRPLTLTAAAAAALAIAVGGDGVWPSGRLLWLGGDAVPDARSGAPTGTVVTDAGTDGEARPAGPAGAASGPETAEATESRGGSGAEAARVPGARGASTAPDPAARRAERAPQKAPDRTGGRETAKTPGQATPAAERASDGPARAVAEPEVEAMARLALLRRERQLLLEDLRALRAAVPPERPAGLLLASGGTFDVVLGLEAGSARPAARPAERAGARPAVLHGEDRPPRLY